MPLAAFFPFQDLPGFPSPGILPDRKAQPITAQVSSLWYSARSSFPPRRPFFNWDDHRIIVPDPLLFTKLAVPSRFGSTSWKRPPNYVGDEGADRKADDPCRKGGKQPAPQAIMRRASVRMYTIKTMQRAAGFVPHGGILPRDARSRPRRELSSTCRAHPHRVARHIAAKGEGPTQSVASNVRDDRDDRSA